MIKHLKSVLISPFLLEESFRSKELIKEKAKPSVRMGQKATGLGIRQPAAYYVSKIAELQIKEGN